MGEEGRACALRRCASGAGAILGPEGRGAHAQCAAAGPQGPAPFWSLRETAGGRACAVRHRCLASGPGAILEPWGNAEFWSSRPCCRIEKEVDVPFVLLNSWLCKADAPVGGTSESFRLLTLRPVTKCMRAYSESTPTTTKTSIHA
eukprot:XP_027300881.1 uncharacterized protein LOC101789867 isoform X1 [Anas platyrhynchos]